LISAAASFQLDVEKTCKIKREKVFHEADAAQMHSVRAKLHLRQQDGVKMCGGLHSNNEKTQSLFVMKMMRGVNHFLRLGLSLSIPLSPPVPNTMTPLPRRLCISRVRDILEYIFLHIKF